MKTAVRLRAALAVPMAAGAVLLLNAGPALAAPYEDDPSIAANTTNPDEGGDLTLFGLNYDANERVALDLHSQVVRLTTVRADANGAFTVTVTLPANFECEHFITGTGLSSDRVARTDIVIGDCDDDDSSGGAGDDDGTDLPATGAAVGGLALAGGLLTAGGVVLVRRRRG